MRDRTHLYRVHTHTHTHSEHKGCGEHTQTHGVPRTVSHKGRQKPVLLATRTESSGVNTDAAPALKANAGRDQAAPSLPDTQKVGAKMSSAYVISMQNFPARGEAARLPTPLPRCRRNFAISHDQSPTQGTSAWKLPAGRGIKLPWHGACPVAQQVSAGRTYFRSGAGSVPGRERLEQTARGSAKNPRL